MSEVPSSAQGLPFSGGVAPRILTFLIADIRGYSHFTLKNGDEAAGRLAAKFAAVGRETIGEYEGMVLELRGDEVLAVFPSARQALRAAMRLQARCAEESEVDPSLRLPIGVGLDAGEPVPVEGGLRGAALNLAARLCAFAAPGEVLITETVANLARRVDGISYVQRGASTFKGFDQPVNVIQIVASSGPTIESQPEQGSPTSRPNRMQPVGGFLGALPPTRLVAREDELRDLARALGTAATGNGRLMVLVGEPGVGKTRLAQEVALLAREGGFVVASGRCYEQRYGVPFYPFVEALSEAYIAAPSQLQSEARKRWPDLARLLPDLLGTRLPTSSGSSDEQEQLFHAISGFLLALAANAPLALLIDDLQWADNTSLELLQHLARETRAAPIFLLVTHRDIDQDWQHPLQAALRNLHREGLIQSMRLARLDAAGTAALVESSLGTPVAPALPDLVHSYSAGNPFFTREVLSALVERGDVYLEGASWELRTAQVTVPDTVRSVIGERLGHLDRSARQVLEEASVLGATFTFADLAIMHLHQTRRAEEELEEALDAATSSKLIVEAGEDGYTFSHALVQQAIYAGLSSPRRRRLHRVAGEVLAQLPTSQAARRASEIAWHFREIGDTTRALRYTLLAGQEAERVFAHGEAERLYRDALDLVLTGRPPTADSSTEADVRWRLGRVLKNMARYEEALQMLEAADTIFADQGEIASRLGVAAEIGTVHFVTGALNDGIARINELLTEIAPSEEPPAATARLYIPLAHLYMAAGQARASLTAAEKAADLSERAGDLRVRAQAHAIRGDALRLLLREDEALRVLQDSMERARSIGDADGEFLALDSVAELLLDRGELRQSQYYRQQAIDVVERMGDPAKIAWELTSLGFLMFCLGDWPAARRHIDRALETVSALPPSRATAYALVRLGNCNIGTGHWSDAQRHLEEGTALSQAHGVRVVELIGHSLLAELDLLNDDPATALQRLSFQLSRQDVPEWSRASLLPLLAWTHFLRGDMRQAREVSEQGIATSRAVLSQLAVLDALRVAGMVRAHDDSSDQAEAAFAEALNIALSMPFPYGAARVMHTWGLVELRRERTAEALKHLRRARKIFEDLGASRDAERCAADQERAAGILQGR